MFWVPWKGYKRAVRKLIIYTVWWCVPKSIRVIWTVRTFVICVSCSMMSLNTSPWPLGRGACDVCPRPFRPKITRIILVYYDFLNSPTTSSFCVITDYVFSLATQIFQANFLYKLRWLSFPLLYAFTIGTKPPYIQSFLLQWQALAVCYSIHILQDLISNR